MQSLQVRKQCRRLLNTLIALQRCLHFLLILSVNLFISEIPESYAEDLKFNNVFQTLRSIMFGKVQNTTARA